MADYSIQDLAHLSGIKPHTIRIWEQRYNLIKPKRSDTNIRTYNDIELKKLLNVSFLVSKGFKISKIASLTDLQLISEINNHHSTNTEDFSNEDEIANFIHSMIEFNEEKFDKVFTTSLIKIGFEQTIIQLIYPFLNRVGILWGANKINPAHEHFICSLIRNKLISAANHQTFSIRKNSIFILFLPANEYHEMALLMTNYLLKSFGFKVVYLGQNVPADCLLETIKQFPKCNVFTHITFPLTNSVSDDLINTANQKKHHRFFISGNYENIKSNTNNTDISFVANIENFKHTISALK
ncbi:MAG: MerR family transcriptional regulator [Chitinophagaceae bacterium]